MVRCRCCNRLEAGDGPAAFAADRRAGDREALIVQHHLHIMHARRLPVEELTACVQHGYQKPSMSNASASPSPRLAKGWGDCLMLSISTVPSTVSLSQKYRTWRCSMKGMPMPMVNSRMSRLPNHSAARLKAVAVRRNRAESNPV